MGRDIRCVVETMSHPPMRPVWTFYAFFWDLERNDDLFSDLEGIMEELDEEWWPKDADLDGMNSLLGWTFDEWEGRFSRDGTNGHGGVCDAQAFMAAVEKHGGGRGLDAMVAAMRALIDGGAAMVRVLWEVQ